MPSTCSSHVVLVCLTSLLFLATISQSAALENVARATDATSCPNPIRIISGKGEGATNKNGRLQTLIDDIKNKYPGTVVEALTYDSPDNATQAREDGRVQMTNDIMTYAANCPDSAIMLLGYSMGGIITMNTLCGDGTHAPLASHYANNIFATVLYGEETWRSGQSYDRGTCKNNAPNIPRADPSACAPFAPNIASWCDSIDPDCCSGGTDSASHLEYPQKYDQDALAFVSAQYEKFTSRRKLI